jgi:hypothetical protein
MTATATYYADTETVKNRAVRGARSFKAGEIRWMLQCLLDALSEQQEKAEPDAERIAVLNAQIDGYTQALEERGTTADGPVEIEEGEIEQPRGRGGDRSTGSTRQSLLATEPQLATIKRVLAERGLEPELFGVTMARLDFACVTRITKDLASGILDKLFDASKRMMSNGQRDLLAKLTVEGHENITMERATAVWTGMQGKVTFDAAKKMIDRAIAANRKRPAKKVTGKLGDGFYMRGEEVFKVQVPATGGNLYAKRLVIEEGVGSEWVYEPGLYNTIQDAQPLTAERALALGAELTLYGVCWCCHRRLTDEQSTRDGIGRRCREKHGW